MENFKIYVVVSFKLVVINEKNVVIECDNNTLLEDDFFLICFEIIDNVGCNIFEVLLVAEFFKNVVESIFVKNLVDNGVEEML